MNLKATNKTETNKYELEVEISAEDFNKALSEVAKTEGKKMSVPGFRKGHAPRSVIEKMYGENVFFEAAVDKLYRPAMQDAIEASGLEVIAVSNADVTSVSRENGIELKLTVVVKPVITIEGYKGIEATKKNVEVTDEDVSAELVKVQDRNSRMVDVDNRGALTGDTAVIDFEGFCDGKAFEGGKAEGFELSLGSGQKIASGAERILLDVKTGSGAFMKTTEDAITLAEEMVEIAKLSGRRAAALITDMDRPLGHAVGNTLEVLEVLETLHGRGPEDLTEECLELAANMIWLGEQAESLEHARKKAKTALETGKAFEKFCEMAEAQGADVRYLREPERFALSPVKKDVCAPRSGYVVHINAEQVGMASVRLGAGREKADDVLDYGAGIVLKKTVGDAVQKGEVIAELYGASAEKCRDAESVLHGAFRYGDEKTEECSLVLARVE